MSTFFDFIRLHLVAVISPALENSLSAGTDVARIEKNFVACEVKEMIFLSCWIWTLKEHPYYNLGIRNGYALSDFSCFKHLPELCTPTNVLQQWNKPRQRQVDIIPVEKLGDRHRDLKDHMGQELYLIHVQFPIGTRIHQLQLKLWDVICCNWINHVSCLTL